MSKTFTRDEMIFVIHQRDEAQARVKELEADYKSARNLLARAHGDGGHYVDKHGFSKACIDAQGEYVRLRVLEDEFEQWKKRHIIFCEVCDGEMIPHLPGRGFVCKTCLEGLKASK